MTRAEVDRELAPVTARLAAVERRTARLHAEVDAHLAAGAPPRPVEAV
jgi:hypothetical protein